jgi:phosphatidylglycerophosphate synthase
MAIGRAWIPNALSVSRVPAAFAFLLVYSNEEPWRYAAAITLAAFALLTDFLDGILARRWRVTSERGYFLDGLGDKAFYIAVLLTMIREGLTSTALAWILIAREVVLYALRSIDPSRLQNLSSLRLYSRAYALFVRLYFGCFFLTDGIAVSGRRRLPLLLYNDVWGYIAAALGVYSIFLLARDIARKA